MKFNELNIIKPILDSLSEKGYENPTPIQEKAIPIVLSGRDLMGCAQTGTGKTASFAIPIIQKLHTLENKPKHKQIKALILTPTRELALQIRDNFREYGKHTDLKCSVIFGGVNQASQVKVLKNGIDILVATPGRLLDLINQKHAKLENVEYLVLDEADTMLDMGFIHDVKKILSRIPDKRQTLLFSATMPKEIEKLSEQFLRNPEKVVVNPTSTTVEKINQTVYYVDKHNKNKLLLDLLVRKNEKSTLIFTRTKHGANKLTTFLNDNKIRAAAIHGNKSQSARQFALSNFKSGKINVLVATDIAARGIDIQELPFVVNYEVPNISETYVHRIGRTGRAGLSGHAVSLVEINEVKDFKAIEKLIKKEITEIIEHDYPMLNHTVSEKKKQGGRPPRSNKGLDPKRKSQKNSYGRPNNRGYKKDYRTNKRG